MAEEHGGNIVCGCLRSADLGSLGLGICHPRSDTLPDDTQLQFGKHPGHLDKSICHRVDLTIGAINGNAPHNHQPQMLRLDNFDDLINAATEAALDITQQICSGVTEAKPYRYKGKNACTYCEYKTLCHFDSRKDSFREIDT